MSRTQGSEFYSFLKFVLTPENPCLYRRIDNINIINREAMSWQSHMDNKRCKNKTKKTLTM